MSKYDDIINLPHHVSENHRRMSLYDRAAQFAPFAALTGHDAAIDETARCTTEQIELSADEQAELSKRLNAAIRLNLEVTICYFKPDLLKDGGAYLTTRSRIKKIDEYEGTLILTDGTTIPLPCVYTISSPEL